MNYAAAFRIFIAGALLLTIGWKAAIPVEGPTYQKDDLVTFLKRNHFDVTTVMAGDVPIVHATTASCHMQVANLFPDGSNRDLIRHLTAGQDRSFVVFGGAVYPQQPIVRTVLSYLRSRLLRELGFAERLATIISVSADSTCNAEQLPWHELPGM